MPLVYDPAKRRSLLMEFMLDFERNKSLEVPGSFPKGNYSISALMTHVDAILTGLFDQVQDLMARDQRWLEEAIEEGEWTHDRPASAGDWHQHELCRALGVMKFLRGQGIDRACFARAAELKERAWRTRSPHFEEFTPKEMQTGQIENYMPLAYLGGLYADAVRNYEEYIPGKQPNIKTARSQRDVAYLLCQHKLDGAHDPAQLQAAVRRLLGINLAANWLGSGSHIKATLWLIIAYAEMNPEWTPQQVVLMAYEHMPNVQRPSSDL